MNEASKGGSTWYYTRKGKVTQNVEADDSAKYVSRDGQPWERVGGRAMTRDESILAFLDDVERCVRRAG